MIELIQNTGIQFIEIPLNIDEDDKYTRNEDDLTLKFDIPLSAALFGGKIEIETLYKTITLKVPKNTKQIIVAH